MEVQNRGWPARFSALCAILFLLMLALPAYAILDLKRGDPAPPISLHSTEGVKIDLADLKGRMVVVLFVEAEHERSRQAGASIARAMMQEAISTMPVSWLILYTKGSDPEAIATEARDIRAAIAHATIIHDVDRQAFGAYHAVALPSTVVIGRDGRIVHAMAGLGPRFEYTVFDALLLAAGRLSEEEFDQAQNGGAEERDEKQRRAERLAQTARRLSQRGQHELAESHFLDALALAPGLIQARLGLADLLLRQERLDDAEAGFRSVLHASPRSLEAAAGLALVHALRGDDAEAERLAREVLERSPSRARAHYALGIVHEMRGEHAQAATSYRKAAEILLERTGGNGDDMSNGDTTRYP